MMKADMVEDLSDRIRELESRLEEAEQLIEAIKNGHVDAFAISMNGGDREIYTIESSDYAYRLLIEECGEGAINVTEDGIIVYSNRYFCQLLDLPYEHVAGKSITDFIDPGSIRDFGDLFEKSLGGKAKGEILLTSNKRNIPVYISLTSLQPKLSTVGIIITDLTEKKSHEREILAYQASLEHKNFSLGKMNTELQSFAHISSHDLQEPVRKMQMITSRILESEFDNLTDHGKDLLIRMQNSSRRMQTLINDLLAYSTTNYEKTNFESTNLKLLLHEVLEDFIDESDHVKLELEGGGHCDINVIPLHFRQVMHNLISNSLKFAKPGEMSVIKVKCEWGNGTDFMHDQLIPKKRYCKITYSDNGIGFEPAYNEKIFGLFQRLHPKERYRGTGIGLAIVKKIIENHEGIITAEGNPGHGAVFHIYLPQ